MVKRVIIMGAGGRDFHNYIVLFKKNPDYRVVAFTMAQIPGIEYRRLPPLLAGPLYPEGIPIYPEEMLPELIARFKVDEVVFSYSDLTYTELGRKISLVLSSNTSFKLVSPFETMIDSIKPVFAVSATKTGAGKSTVSRAVAEEMIKRNLKFIVVRHPMVYGDFERMIVQEFNSIDDLDRYTLTIEEREEYEHHLRMGVKVLAGIDYIEILNKAEQEADIILWDGGNNDVPFYRPWYQVTVTDAMRPGIELNSYPGEINVRLADTIIITKVSQARTEDVNRIVKNIMSVNKRANIVKADMEVEVDKPELLEGRKALIIEDAPSVTHGGLPYGAGYIAALKYNAEVVDPRPYAKGIIRKIYEMYSHIGPVLPSVGYTQQQLNDLEETINSANCDVVILGSPADVTRIIKTGKPFVRVKFNLKIVDGMSIKEIIDEFIDRVNKNVP
ncbi:MAG: cyclic 2,3-diphosphoglycerate synthase [Ignisphaera sp.]|nr:cyclic 2,3-diphosphoglycerate synthase [Ignisphaera sp.]MCX8168142.1 cyclic 2,3-diphosphoglycerate synthase [Ignisphaera sp.]MDW8085218.1 cyclic 2,3-diphosphoglycerate synthase [Ignisphaera sp.]